RVKTRDSRHETQDVRLETRNTRFVPSWDRIAHACRGHSRGMVEVKGKGEMEMYVVEGLR
ncbi:MAG: hypothetical protein WBN93_14765, partial [Acidimicrobiia bacterium]